jgi:hypothetical protein
MKSWSAGPVRAVGAIASLTVLTVAISEPIFWGQPDQAYGEPLGLLLTFAAYGVVVVAVVGVLERLATSTWLGVFLGGALLGWAIEGIVVTTTYEALPFSISFTGLAWHALISVAWGWVLLPRWLTWGSRGLARLVVVGWLWGMWGAWMSIDSEEHASTAAFAAYAAVTGVVLGSGLMGWLRWRSPTMVSRTVLVIALGMISVAAVVRVISLPWSPLVLGPCLAGAVWGLRRLPRGRFLLVLEPGPGPKEIARGIAVLIVAAVVTYAAARGARVPVAYGPAVYIVTTAAGFGLFVRALWLAAHPVVSAGRSGVE